MPNPAARPDPLQQASDKGEIPVRRRQPLTHHQLAGQSQMQIAGQRRHPGGVGHRDLGGRCPRQLHRPAHPGPQSELHHGRERQTLPDQLPRPRVAGAPAGQQSVHTGLVVQVRRHDSGQGPGIVDRVQHIADQVVQCERRPGLVQIVREQRAQRELVRGIGHVPRTVCGVLRRVVEEQRLALLRQQGDVTTGEQLRHRRRGERCQRRTQEADAVVHRTGRTAVVLRRTVRRLLVQDGEGEPGVLQLLRIARDRHPVRASGAVEHDDGQRIRATRRGGRPRQGVERLRRLGRCGRDEVPDTPFVPADTGPPDLVRGGDELLRVGLRRDGRPPRPPAVPQQ